MYDIKNLTLDEKIKLVAGKNNWQLETANGKLPQVFLADGPHGLRKVSVEKLEQGVAEKEATYKTTAMPNICVLSNTWNTEMAYLQGETIADDCLECGADVLLAPGVNIKRTPLCGRNFEYFSEDPYLSGYMAKAFIEGVQSKGVGTSLKHFCCNNREYDRWTRNSEVDERALREIYLPAFEIAVKAEPWTVMCSYNPVNGVYASENKKLLDGVLRGDFGFNGLIMSDWNAVQHSAKAIKNTLDLEMPYRPEAYTEIKQGLDDGYLTEAELDRAVLKVLALIEKAQTSKKEVTTTKEKRHENALEIAREGITLLKNEGGILPLTGGNVFVSGAYAYTTPMGGGGSALALTDYKMKYVYEEINARLGEKGKAYTGKGVVSTSPFTYAWTMKHDLQESYHADTVVLCVGTNDTIESESYDRFSIRLSKQQEEYIKETAKVNENIVVVLFAGSAIDCSPWIDKVKAVVLAGFLGEAGSEAVADILTGKINPSGKLTETYPLCLEDTPTGDTIGTAMGEKYEEGIFVGYRWYDKKQKDALFPFGHGLSYAKFAYSNLEITKFSETDYEISYWITNVSNVDGKEVSQVYIKDILSTLERPEKELKGFAKTYLKAGESKKVSHKLDRRSFAYFMTAIDDWYVENGDFEVLVGASSKDIRLTGKIQINLPKYEQVSSHYTR